MGLSYSQIRSKVLSRVKPTVKEKKRFLKASNDMISDIKELFITNDITVEVSLGGSIAKNTQLRNAKDIDLFLKFPPIPYAHKDISKIAYDILKKKYDNIKRIHATRDYFHIEYDNILFEIIPVIDVENASLQHRIMDASPHHVMYVNENLKNNDEVRLLKQFLKAQKLYGAESHIRGFSGYTCELLIILHKTFKNLISTVKDWNTIGEYYDMEGHYDNKKEAISSWSIGKHTPLIIIDPVQPDRNASASIDEKAYMRFIMLSNKFHDKPTISAFYNPIIRNKGRYVEVRIRNTDLEDHTFPAKMRSLHEKILRELATFIVIGEEYEYNEDRMEWTTRVWLGTFLLPKIMEVQGPPVRMRQSAKAFIEKHDNIIEKDMRLYAIEERQYRKPEEIIDRIIKDSRHYNNKLSISMKRRTA
ncbi:MAG: hypothetical protein ACMXYL_03340 [Candidatus Woesearchaeota archaeon]